VEYGYWLPPNLSANGDEIDFSINIIHLMMVVLFVGWGLFMTYCLWTFRAREGHTATYEPIKAKFSTYIEVGVSIAEVVLLVGLSMPVWADIKEDFPAEKDAVMIRVVAEQFKWNFHYPGKDGIFGKTSADAMSDENPLGLDEDDEAGYDDFWKFGLRFPVGKPVIVRLTSKDVIHSFNLNVMRVKQDAIPGMEIAVWFEARATGKDLQVGCAQLCGIGHATMQAAMIIDETPEQFQAWLDAEHKALGLGD
jgi:cytochrome c oxidase subunit 2